MRHRQQRRFHTPEAAPAPFHLRPRSAAPPLTAVPEELSDTLGVLLPVVEALAVSLGVGGPLGVPDGLREREGVALRLAVPLADSLALCRPCNRRMASRGAHSEASTSDAGDSRKRAETTQTSRQCASRWK
jgi:hypothetical protein